MNNNKTGWDFGLASEAEWMPWGDGNNATARIVFGLARARKNSRYASTSG